MTLHPAAPPCWRGQRVLVLMEASCQSRLVRNETPYFLWTIKRDSIDYHSLSGDQMLNHYGKTASFTTKVRGGHRGRASRAVWGRGAHLTSHLGVLLGLLPPPWQRPHLCHSHKHLRTHHLTPSDLAVSLGDLEVSQVTLRPQKRLLWVHSPSLSRAGPWLWVPGGAPGLRRGGPPSPAW